MSAANTKTRQLTAEELARLTRAELIELVGSSATCDRWTDAEVRAWVAKNVWVLR